jgi:hypothetical protein
MPSNDQSLGCCDEPPCPTVTLLCNSISASKSKCGFLISGVYYLVRTQPAYCEGNTCSWEYVCCYEPFHYYDNVRTYDATTCTFTDTNDTGGCDFVGCNQKHTPFVFPYRKGDAFECQDPASSGCSGGHGYSSYVYTAEYTTADLISNTVAALPAYADCFSCTSHSTDSACTNLITGQGCTCSAFRNLSTDETSYTIRRFKYKFRFTASVTCRLKILWNETFKPTLTAAVDFCSTHYAIGAEDPDPSHWTVTAKTYNASTGSDPCGPVIGPPSGPAGTNLEKDSGEYTVNEPSTNGTIYITDVRWTILDGNNDTDVYNPAPIDYTNPCSPVAAEPNCIPAG